MFQIISSDFFKEAFYLSSHTNWLIDADACMKEKKSQFVFILIVEKKCITDIHGADVQNHARNVKKDMHKNSNSYLSRSINEEGF